MNQISVETLQSSCKHLMIDLGLDKRGSRQTMAVAIGENKNFMSMALSGYRNTPATRRILEKLHTYLTKLTYRKDQDAAA